MKIKLMLLLILVLFISITTPFILTCILSLLNLWLPNLDIVGSIDSWIGFLGSILGAILTVVILYFTIVENEIDKNRPSVIGELSNIIYDDRLKKLDLKNYINNYDFICWKYINISQNIVNGLTITNEIFEVYDEKLKIYIKYKDIYENFGISMYTVLLEEYGILKPNGYEEMKTNISIDRNDNGVYKFIGSGKSSSFSFKHILTITYSDITEKNKYKTLFEYEILINLDTNNNLVFFVQNTKNKSI